MKKLLAFYLLTLMSSYSLGEIIDGMEVKVSPTWRPTQAAFGPLYPDHDKGIYIYASEGSKLLVMGEKTKKDFSFTKSVLQRMNAGAPGSAMGKGLWKAREIGGMPGAYKIDFNDARTISAVVAQGGYRYRFQLVVEKSLAFPEFLKLKGEFDKTVSGIRFPAAQVAEK